MYAYVRKYRSGFRKRQTDVRRALHAAGVVVGALCSAASARDAADGPFTRGNELYGTANYAEAAVYYKKSIREGANSSLANFNRGNCFYRLNMVPKAIACYREAIDEAPGFFAAYLNLGVLYQMHEDWPATVSVLEVADAIEPDNKQVVLILAIAYRNLKAYAPAVERIEQAIGLDSTLYDCYFLLFDVYRELEDFAAAVDYLDRYPDTEKRAAEKYRLLAGIADAQGETEKSAFLYRKEIGLAPGNRAARYNLVNALHKCGHGLLALQTVREALHRFGDYTDLALLGGNIAFERNFLRDAEDFYRTAYAHGDVRGLIGLQNVAKRAGDPGKN